ncbi:TetR family transcriptional regulator [Sphaerotilus hippei]|uniref:TetR family transcriptional regulator n=1 Tax=Sphaerotilus hippei TaxID=744406 RepID=A0A318H2D7_9BURK|nr:TetR family transcriptional regulator [Sphaerotilus hippei]PXW97407.1 TetR family transcriptional regulator [Sphaerotilus hippei]
MARPPATESRTRDAERSRQALLAAARTAFAEQGLGGTRLDDVAARAGLDKRLIYYYFKNKDQLFTAVLEEVYAGIRSAEAELHLGELPPVEAITRLVDFTWQYYLDHPEFIALINDENLHRAQHLARSGRIPELHSPLVVTLGAVLERGRTDGVFRGGVDPQQLYISIAGMCYFYLSNRHTLSVIFGRAVDQPKALAERISHVREVVMGYLLR